MGRIETRLPARRDAAALASSLATRVLLFALLWWALVEGEVGSRSLAGVAVGIAVAVSYRAIPRGGSRPHAAGLLRFVPYFLGQSLSAGVDVALRALHPQLPIRPGFTVYPLRLPEGAAQIFFANAVSLLPGTISIRLEGGHLRVHLLDRETEVNARLEALEDRVAALFWKQGLHEWDPGPIR